MKSVFISSTFRDMQIERDALHTRIFPLLNEEAAKYSEVFTGIDLRWGIQTSQLSEQEADKKAFLTCFDEIDSSRPYFIAFIGDRYGTNVNEDSISRIFNLILNKDKMTKKEIKEFIKKTSITQKEIEYATFVSKIPPSNCFFFLRKGYGKTLSKKEKDFWIENDEESREKLELLKKQIKNKYPESFYEYSLEYDEDKGFYLPEKEIKQFADFICNTFLKDYKNKIRSPHEVLKQQMSFFSKERDFGFFGRKEDYRVLEKFLKDNATNILILKGQSGLGKTSLLSHLIETEKENYNFLPVFIGTTPTFMNEKGILKYLHESINEIKGNDPNESSDFTVDDEATYRNVTHENIRCTGIKALLSKPIKEGEKPLVIVLDSLNTIHGSPYLETLDFLPIYGLAYGIKIIISTTDDSNLSLFKCAASGLVKHELKPLKSDDIKTISYNVLSKVFHKESSEKMIENIMQKKNSFEPLYLSLLLRRLLLVNRYDFDRIYRDKTSEDARYNYLENLIKDEAELSEELATSLFEKVVEFSSAKFLNTAFSYISLSPYGLTIQDLEELVPQFDETDFYIAIRFLDPLFYRDEQGRISFSHERIRTSVQKNNNSTKNKSIETLIDFYKQKGKDRYSEYVAIVFDNYSTNKSLIKSLLAEEKDENIDETIFNRLFNKLVEEFANGNRVLYDCLFEDCHYSLLCKLLKRIINESRLDALKLRLIGELSDESPFRENDLLDKTSLSLGLRSLFLMILQSKNIFEDSLKDTFDYIQIAAFRALLKEEETFRDMFCLFIYSCFKYFGVSSYDKNFINDFISVTENLGKDYAIYHLSVKELLIFDEPESADRTIKLENLLGEANFLKERKRNNSDLDRFINRVSLAYFLDYSKGHDKDAILKLAEDVFINTNFLSFIEISHEYQKNIAKVIFTNAEAADLDYKYNKSNMNSLGKAFNSSKSAFLLSSFLASQFLDEDMIEVAIDSFQLNVNVAYKEGLLSDPKNLKNLNSLVKALSEKNNVNPLIKGKHLMVQGFSAIEDKKYEKAIRLYTSAISYLKKTTDFKSTLAAYEELSWSLQSKLKETAEDNKSQTISNKTLSGLFIYLIGTFEKGLNISYYDCDKVRTMFRDSFNISEINDDTYALAKLGCYLAYCSYYQTNQPTFIREANQYYPLLIDYFKKHPDIKKEYTKFLNTLKKYDPYDLIPISLGLKSNDNVIKLVSDFENMMEEHAFDAFKLLAVVDRGGFQLEKMGDLDGASKFYGTCWELNKLLLKKFPYCFGYIQENLVSIEAYNRVLKGLNNYFDTSLCMHYLIAFANLLRVTPFRSQKAVTTKIKVQLEHSFAICIQNENLYEHLEYVIEQMDEYYSYSMNFANVFEYEKQYVFYSYYRLLFGFLTNNQHHINKGCSDISQAFIRLFYFHLNELEDIMDEAELAALVTASTIITIQGPKEMVDAFKSLPELYPEALESDAIMRFEFREA